MSEIVHRCDLRSLVEPAIRTAIDSAPSGDYFIRIDETVRCPHCRQWWLIEGSSTVNGEAALTGERRGWYRWWR